jgi:hypothetical protein
VRGSHLNPVYISVNFLAEWLCCKWLYQASFPGCTDTSHCILVPRNAFLRDLRTRLKSISGLIGLLPSWIRKKVPPRLDSISSRFNVLVNTPAPIDAKTHVWPIDGIAQCDRYAWSILEGVCEPRSTPSSVKIAKCKQPRCQAARLFRMKPPNISRRFIKSPKYSEHTNWTEPF